MSADFVANEQSPLKFCRHCGDACVGDFCGFICKGRWEDENQTPAQLQALIRDYPDLAAEGCYP